MLTEDLVTQLRDTLKSLQCGDDEHNMTHCSESCLSPEWIAGNSEDLQLLRLAELAVSRLEELESEVNSLHQVLGIQDDMLAKERLVSQMFLGWHKSIGVKNAALTEENESLRSTLEDINHEIRSWSRATLSMEQVQSNIESSLGRGS